METTMNSAVLIGNERYGLYIGYVSATDAEIVATKHVRVARCRHVCRWFGRSGGITSLAAFGPCGPRVEESLVGAECDALLTGVVAVYELTEEAIAAFASIVPT